MKVNTKVSTLFAGSGPIWLARLRSTIVKRVPREVRADGVEAAALFAASFFLAVGGMRKYFIIELSSTFELC